MPIFSYLAYPTPGAKEELQRELAAMAHCEVTPSDNSDILILVTDTPDDDTEKQLIEKLKGLRSLQSLGMTFGHVDE